MAALIAQIARQHHERKVRLKQTYPIEKSRYNLPPFEDSFQPKRDVKVFDQSNHLFLESIKNLSFYSI